MADSYKYIYENNRDRQIKFLLIFISGILFIGAAWFSLFSLIQSDTSSQNFFLSVYKFLKDQIKTFTLSGLFFSGFLGSLFFSFFPLEISFYYGLLKDNPPFLSLLFIMAGLLPAEIFNYVAGKKLSNFMLYFVSLKKVYATKRLVNKYGGYGIFLFNLIPIFPSPLLTFALGITKYNSTRLFIILIIADILKFAAIIMFFSYARHILETFL